MAKKTTGSTTKTTTKKTTKKTTAPKVTRRLRVMSEEERQRLVAEAAYFRAAQRNFEPGHEVEDWLEAEKQIERQQ